MPGCGPNLFRQYAEHQEQLLRQAANEQAAVGIPNPRTGRLAHPVGTLIVPGEVVSESLTGQTTPTPSEAAGVASEPIKTGLEDLGIPYRPVTQITGYDALERTDFSADPRQPFFDC